MTRLHDTLIVVRDQSERLIAAEIRSIEQRNALERAVREAITKLGYGIDEVSEASGLTPDEIRRVLSEVPEWDELDIAGLK